MLYRLVNLVLYISKRLLIAFLLIPWATFSQGISNLWLTGYNGGNYDYFGVSATNFISGFPDTSHSSVTMNFLDCNANISDSLGNLLYYTNGIYIANANNDTMVNGSNLNPAPYTTQQFNNGLRIKQGNLILPKPNSSNIYYLFHETLFLDQSINDYRTPEIFYSVIDMSLDNGRGAVTQKNVLLLSDTLSPGGITACKHGNGRDWWIVFHKSKGRRYYKFLLTPSGLQGPFAQDIGYSVLPRDWIWQSSFSSNGLKFSTAFTKDTFDIMDFDRCTGLFTNVNSIYVNDSAQGRGVAFSPNSQYLYYSSENYLYQYNIASSPISASQIKIGTYDKYVDLIPPIYTQYFTCHLGYDHKIYILSGNGSRWLTVINDPDSLGDACNVLEHSFYLPTYNAWTIPNFPNYFLGKESGAICDSLSFGSIQIERVYQNPILPPAIVSDDRGEAVQYMTTPISDRNSYKGYLLRSDSLILNTTKSKKQSEIH